MKQVLRAALTVAISVVATVVVASTWPPADAQSAFTLVAPADRNFGDASDDGRYVLVVMPTAVIDRQTGQSTSIDVSSSPGQARLSGDGTRVVFISFANLVAADTDADGDVYEMRVNGTGLTLMTPGVPGWRFSETVEVDRDGGRVIARADNGNLARTTAFLADGSTTRELTGGVSSSVNGSAYGISDDGNVLLYSTDSGCGGAPGCAGYRLYTENITDPLHPSYHAVGALNGVPLGFADAVLSGDGQHVLIREVDTGLLYMDGATGGGAHRVTDTRSEVGPTGTSITISRDGQKFTWLQNSPTTVGSNTMSLPQLMLGDGTSTMLASAPAVGRPDGNVGGGMVVGNGSALLFDSLATNLIAGTQDGWKVFGRVIAPVPPVDPVPPADPVDPGPPSGPVSQLPPNDAAGTASFFIPHTPQRIVDTRTGLGYTDPRPAVGTRIHVPIRNLYGVPADASAVAVQITAAGGSGVGFVSAIPTTATPTDPSTSTLNLDVAGEAVANMAVVPIGVDGSITVYTDVPTHIIVDLVGWWTPTQTALSAGRYRPVGPNRILDTRPASAVNWSAPKPAAGSTVTIHVAGSGGVPAAGASAVAINLTVVEPDSPGFIQAAPGNDLVVGASSTTNISAAGQTVAATTVVPIDANGDIAIYVQPSTHLVIDISGWFTNAAVPAGSDGLFKPLPQPVRRIWTIGRVGYNGMTSIGTRFDNGSDFGALIGNLTITQTAGAGYVQLGPTATMANGATSNINATAANETVANAAFVPLSSGMGVYTSNATHVIVDVSGYMTPTMS